MAAANALLQAAGFVKKSTVTQPATSSSSTATEHATVKDELDATVKDELDATVKDELDTAELVWMLGDNEHCFSLGDNELEKILALLMWIAQDFRIISNISVDDIHEAALASMTKYQFTLLNPESLAKLSELIDIMMLHKDGSAKDANDTWAFMRRVAIIRDDVRATLRNIATELVEQSTWSDNDTGRVQLDTEEVGLCYRRFGRILLTHDLLPHQKADNRYRLRNKCKGDTTVTSFQRSFIDSLLRKKLGDKKVALLIWQHGLPSISDAPLSSFRPRVDDKQHFKGMLQSSLNKCLYWYSCLANEIVVHKSQEGFRDQLSASSLDEETRQPNQTRRDALQKARDTWRTGAALAKLRNKGKRSYRQMNDAEQKILKDFDRGTIKKAKQDLSTPRMKPFRCTLQSQDWVQCYRAII